MRRLHFGQRPFQRRLSGKLKQQQQQQQQQQNRLSQNIYSPYQVRSHRGVNSTCYMFVHTLSTYYPLYLYLLCFILQFSTALDKILDVTSEIQ